MDELRVTVLADNTAGARGVWAEHGLALLVETRSARVLFDTGQSGAVLVHNAEAMDIPLGDLRAVVLSHGHYDHTGGLPDLLRRTGGIEVHAHPRVFARKYRGSRDRPSAEIGAPYTERAVIEMGAILRLAGEPVWLADDILLTGEIPNSVSFEDVPRDFLVERGGELVTDFLRDEQAMAVRTSRGLAVILGCGHPGVINTVNHCRRLAGAEVCAVIGGMHLETVSPTRLHLTIQALLELGVERVAPLHCTGFGARAEMACRMKEVFVTAAAGDTIAFE